MAVCATLPQVCGDLEEIECVKFRTQLQKSEQVSFAQMSRMYVDGISFFHCKERKKMVSEYMILDVLRLKSLVNLRKCSLYCTENIC